MTSPKVFDNSLTAADLATGAVGLSELASDAKAVGINGVMVVPAAAFQPDLKTRDYFLSSGGNMTPGIANATLCVVAPVYLPHGVLVTQFDIIAWDNSANGSICSRPTA